ncbi:hypothetical protein CYMTET_7436 [Cymbomonas tetramitiformis]|uniref:Uncharacterized protein n=1 Tax=Cymbomonas tetramitiformis TaxID=36881 RepID=A0AAE0GV49_9CHLO|nr:hypothetical protein CYMTET_7436 [Cymbomonas tetramitiformis]
MDELEALVQVKGALQMLDEEDVPAGVKLLEMSLVLKVKLDKNRELLKRKSRLLPTQCFQKQRRACKGKLRRRGNCAPKLLFFFTTFTASKLLIPDREESAESERRQYGTGNQVSCRREMFVGKLPHLPYATALAALGWLSLIHMAVVIADQVWSDAYQRIVQRGEGFQPMCGEDSFALSTGYNTPDLCKQKCDSMGDGCNVIYYYGSSCCEPECGGKACPDCFYYEEADGEIAYSEGCELVRDGGSGESAFHHESQSAILMILCAFHTYAARRMSALNLSPYTSPSITVRASLSALHHF